MITAFTGKKKILKIRQVLPEIQTISPNWKKYNTFLSSSGFDFRFYGRKMNVVQPEKKNFENQFKISEACVSDNIC